MKNELWRILAGLGAAFGAPWLFLIVLPYLKMASAESVPYSEDDGVELAAYPDPHYGRVGESDYGAQIYAREGCAYCHTQVVRPTYAGADMWRSGWGGREAEGLARETRPADYAGESFAYLGYQRIGPDLANVGSRIDAYLKGDDAEQDDPQTVREWHYRHLYEPQSMNHDARVSVMPPFKHLFRKAPEGAANAIEMKDGHLVVRTTEASALVDYLLPGRKIKKFPAAETERNKRIEMNYDAEDSRNLDYEAEGASVLEVHETVQREKAEPAIPGMEPAGKWVTILCGLVVALGGGFLFANANKFSGSVYTTDYYRPDPRPDLGGGAAVVEELSWIDQWMKDGKSAYGNCRGCHQVDGNGVPGQFPPLVGSEWVDGGTKRIAAIVLHGVKGPLTVGGQTYGAAEAMQPWGTLSDENIAQVITYVRRSFGSLPEGEDGIVTAEMIEAAREEFSGMAEQWTEPELEAIPGDAMLPGSKVDLLTGQPLP